MTSSQHNPIEQARDLANDQVLEPDVDMIDNREWQRRAAAGAGVVDGRELTRRMAEASRRDGARA